MQPYYSQDGITIYHADCRDVLPTLEPGSVDLVCTDPPYGIPAGSAFWRQNGTEIQDWRDEGHNALVEGWHHMVPLTEPAAIVEFCSSSFEATDRTRQAHQQAGWTNWRLFILVKSAPPPTPRPTMVHGWESAVISYVGKRPWYGSGYVPDCWSGLTPNRLGVGVHPTQKPIEPMLTLIQALSPLNAVVLDPFMGSGTTLRAAKDLGRKAIGIEVEERYCEIAAKRLQQAVLPLEMLA